MTAFPFLSRVSKINQNQTAGIIEQCEDKFKGIPLYYLIGSMYFYPPTHEMTDGCSHWYVHLQITASLDLTCINCDHLNLLPIFKTFFYVCPSSHLTIDGHVVS